MFFLFKLETLSFFQIEWIKVSNKLFKQFDNNFSLTPLRLFPEIMAATIDQKDRNKKLARSVELFAIRLYCLHYNHHLSLDDKTFLRKNNHSQALWMPDITCWYFKYRQLKGLNEDTKSIWLWMLETMIQNVYTYICFTEIHSLSLNMRNLELRI